MSHYDVSDDGKVKSFTYKDGLKIFYLVFLIGREHVFILGICCTLDAFLDVFNLIIFFLTKLTY